MHDKFLNYFDETARQGSIRKAAAVLNMSSSSLNRKIIRTENRLGIRLFDRRADGVTLTEAGVVVLEHCRNTLFDYQRIVNMVEDIRDMRTGHIHIMTLDSIALSVLPEVLDDFQDAYPQVAYTIQTAEPHDVMQAVAEETADIGLSFSNDLHPDVRCQAEKSTPIGAIMANDHPLAERDLIEVGDLAPYQLIRSYDSQSHRSFVNDAVASVGVQLSTQLSTNSLPLAKAMIRNGRGIGVYSKIGFVDEIEDGQLRYVALNSPLLRELRIGVLTSARTGLLPVQHLLARALSKSLRSLRLDS
ncbi:MAG: DNA-binding transcriptional LysR family regulator [Sulfitobacter sp.]|jgi:DNA-binding transcriptional LysR family regulator